MNTTESKATDGVSPCGQRQYMLLHSPKAGIPSKSKLPFLILFIGVGIVVTRSWSDISARMIPGCSALPKSEPITYTESIERQEDAHIRKHTANASRPLIWLMSFPNSGTSYTSYLVRTVTGKDTATNYGREHLGTDGTSVPVFKEKSGGPFWTTATKDDSYRPKQGYIITKTHCGGRCDLCGPDGYIENHRIFSRRCVEGYHIENDAITGEPREVLDHYSPDLVAGAVHLIRDPFDNVISRFHLTLNRLGRKNDSDKLARYPRSKEGFRALCMDWGNSFYHEEKASKFYDDVFDDVKDIPCHADFFMYIQWHNLAFTTTWNLRIPSLILHYENYTSNFNQTKTMLLEFLEQDEKHEPPPFETGKSYRDYYAEGEIQKVSTMFSKLALGETWAHTKHYFD